MKILKLILTAALTLTATLNSRGEDVLRPVLSAYTVTVGSAHTAETYLSPLRYSGQTLGIHYERMQAMKFNPREWVAGLRFSLEGAHTKNPARNGTIWQAYVSGGWGMMHRWRTGSGITLYGGGSSDIEAGALYNVRNSNNPVAAKASWTVSAMGAAAWNGSIGRLPVTVRYMLRVPVTGIFFSPEYGELYYEIYLGNRRNLVHGAWPGNLFRMDNQLTADLHFGATVVRLGYRLDIGSSKSSDIVTRQVSHCLIAGFCSEWLSLPVKSDLHEAEIISALY